jgi:hypothetical protein
MEGRYHLVRQQFINKKIYFIFVEGYMNFVDYLSKPSDVCKFKFDRDRMMIGNDNYSIILNKNKYIDRIVNKKRKNLESK